MLYLSVFQQLIILCKVAKTDFHKILSIGLVDLSFLVYFCSVIMIHQFTNTLCCCICCCTQWEEVIVVDDSTV